MFDFVTNECELNIDAFRDAMKEFEGFCLPSRDYNDRYVIGWVTGLAWPGLYVVVCVLNN